MTRLLPPPLTPWRRGAFAVALATLLVLSAVGCSSDDDGGRADRSASTTTVADAGDTDDAPTTTAAGGSSTSAPSEPGATSPSSTANRPAPTTSLLPAGTEVPADPPANSKGVPITLDETALLACAQNQFAWVARNEQRPADAAAALRIAAERAGASSVAAVAARADDLSAAAEGRDTDATVSAFLDLCETNGFEY